MTGFNVKLKYVGDFPIVSKHGIGFDHTKPDKYIYLQAAVQLLEALNYGATKTTKHLYNAQDKDMGPDELVTALHKYVKNMDEIIQIRDAKNTELAEDLIARVEDNETLTEDEQTAWLGNIKMMQEYYHQYITNKTAYFAALDALADEIHDGVIKEVCVPMFKNYGMVLTDLSEVLEKRKSPIESDILIEQKTDGIFGTLCISHK